MPKKWDLPTSKQYFVFAQNFAMWWPKKRRELRILHRIFFWKKWQKVAIISRRKKKLNSPDLDHSF
jgi:hypothetical protein